MCRSASLSNSIVNATSEWERRVGSGGRVAIGQSAVPLDDIEMRQRDASSINSSDCDLKPVRSRVLTTASGGWRTVENTTVDDHARGSDARMICGMLRSGYENRVMNAI